MVKGKNTNSLMRHLRDNHNIDIQGSKDKKNLMNMGYYHGYKGYRYIKIPQNTIEFQSFSEVVAIYEFDMMLKTIFYPNLMMLETALKNHVLEVIIKKGSADFEHVFTNLLNDYKKENAGSKKYKKKMKSRLNLRDHIYDTISRSFASDKPVIQHFFHKNEPIPLWAIFEVITLGSFGSFVHCLNEETRLEIANEIGLKSTNHNHNGRLVEKMVFAIKDLRNAVAHNSVIFDCRFKQGEPAAELKAFLSSETGVRDVTFDNIVDYLVLVIYLKKNFGATKTELKKIIKDFSRECEHFGEVIPREAYSAILGTDFRTKITRLLRYV
ncbi:Abi family protein [Sporosarcina jeotgali]|uniref:Abi family protein n=1 Tax=Sporosarcina jeotgali TaxID=3020056 RepID=A0ABZ0KVB2_9BACL|nr:Abi family protein [Sporosarcina sp. B2O-1]WOV83900.1 Abi family protein [Sporosarcina sp. B2O-1]